MSKSCDPWSNFRETILSFAPSLEWVGQADHPIHKLGTYHFGISEGFLFDREAVMNADENLLKEIGVEIARYWVNNGICTYKYTDYTNP